MNENGRNAGWNSNQQMSKGHMNQNHVESCGCGCKQNEYEYKQQQNQYEQNDNQYMVNHQGSQNYGESYPYQENFYKPEQSYNSSYGPNNPSEYLGQTLPEESKRFQRITNINNTNNRVMDAYTLSGGESLENDRGACPNVVPLRNTVVNAESSYQNDSQYFIFYKTDNGQFVIANLGNGRVLDTESYNYNNFTYDVVISDIYKGNRSNQIFKKELVAQNQFRLTTTRNNENLAINNCNGEFNKFQTYVAVPGNVNNVYKIYDYRSPSFALPNLSTPTTLDVPENLKSRDDLGVEPNVAPRAIIGNALIPCILVNDYQYSLADKMKNHPYYKLEYRKYWHRLWTDLVPYAITDTKKEERTGMVAGNQNNMENIINMSVGNDLGLRFNTMTDRFKMDISSALGIKVSYANNLGEILDEYTVANVREANGVRYVRYALGHEFVLTRSDGSEVGKWYALDPNNRLTRTFPTVQTASIEDEELLKITNK
nr:Tpp36-like protein [Bacillus thuringiensis]